MKLAIVLGTRPEIIKMSPIIRECMSKGIDHYVIHSGQHYSKNMDEVFFDQLMLERPQYMLETGSGTHAQTTAKALTGIEDILRENRPSAVLVQGDTNTTFSGALAAAKLHIEVSHIEAGLRSYDRSMPEEINRIMTDSISDLLFAPTQKSAEILLSEGIAAKRVFVTGNTVVDAAYQNLKIAEEKSRILESLGLHEKGYILITAHREENADNRKKLEDILKGIESLCDETGIRALWPMHPRTIKRIREFGLLRKLDGMKSVTVLKPLGFLDFLLLELNARLILTDSGGVQEEACIMGVPCVTLRESTERPETIEVGSNTLAGTNPERITACSKSMLEIEPDWNNPFGDGNAASKIIDIVTERSWVSKTAAV